MALTIDGGSSNPSDFFVTWKDDVANVRELYGERKYRRCAVLCSELLPKATHPVHKTFLFFYQAVCYETLGHISHDYSSNKISLYEQARDAFVSAGETLPLPFLTAPDGRYDAPGPSPICATFDVLEHYEADSPSVYPTPPMADQTPRRSRSMSGASSMTRASPGAISVAYTVPNFDDYSPRQSGAAISPSRSTFREDPSKNTTQSFLTPRQRAASLHKARLSRSLSSQHALAEYLIPSPLFSRGPSSKEESQSETDSEVTNPLPLVTLSKPLPPTPINRPLPALPFNHQPKFILKGKRFVIVPKRKTALATLISRFEGHSPFDSPVHEDGTGREMVLSGPTPTTDRFKRISATFIEREDPEETPRPRTRVLRELKNFNGRHLKDPKRLTIDDENTVPFTPCPKPHQRQISHPIPSPHYKPSSVAIPSSPASHLASYNITLSSLRTAIKTHTTTTTSRITQTRTIQLAHEDEKRRRFANMHSRHCHSSAIPEPTSPTKSMGKSRGANRESSPVPAKDARLRSFWSLQIADAQARTGSPGIEEEKANQRRERIEKLRAGGWRGIRKEEKGWKGSGYYAELRRVAEGELSSSCC